MDLRLMKLGSVALALGLTAALAGGQLISPTSQRRTAAPGNAVQYLFPEQVTVPAGKASAVALHFRVTQGLHINSHTPTDEFLIPTLLSFPDGTGVKLASTSYPAGTTIALPLDPKTKLNVYTGEFVIQTKIVATRGNHLVEAKLRYQACDNSQCMPPKTITAPIDVIGK
jgi:hypothetical protein